MSLQTLSEWLRCPICFEDLSARPPLALACRNGHAFDANKRGFVNLVSTSRKIPGDTPAMLDARARFLSAGWYTPLRRTLAEAVEAAGARRVLDAGCGTGYYLDGVLGSPTVRDAVGIDVSPAAVARTVRSVRESHPLVAVDGVVADVWAPLPVRDAAADAILNVFAPRNPPEFHRVLRDGGLLAVVVPHDSHLSELRTAGLMLDVQADKAALLIDALAPLFGLTSRHLVTTEMSLDPDHVSALVGMGPTAHHAGRPAAGAEALTERTASGVATVHAAFELLLFRKNPA